MKETSPTEVLILAGGYGARMGIRAEEEQKCMLPLADRPVIWWVMSSLQDAFGSVDMKIAVGHKADGLIDYVEHNKPSVNVRVSYHLAGPGIGSWGAYWSMRDAFKKPFLGIPGDVVTEASTYLNAYSTFIAEKAEAVLTFSPRITIADSHDIGRVRNGKVVDIIYPAPLSIRPNYLRDMTIYGADNRLFQLMEQYPAKKKSLIETTAQAVAVGRELAAHISLEPWLHIAYEEDLRNDWPAQT